MPKKKEESETYCGNYGNSLLRIFGKNVVKLTVLLNKLLKSWFDEIFFRCERIFYFSTLCESHSSLTLWKSRNFTAMVFSQKFRQINVLLNKELCYELIWWKKICVAVNFSFFHTVSVEITEIHCHTSLTKISWK